jgi:hypothetical protein
MKEFTDINNNVDSKLITSNIVIAQDIHLQRITGTVLYQSLMDKVKNNTLAGDYKALLDNYVQDVVLWSSYYEILESIYLRPRNNGLLVPTGGENSRDADMTLYEKKRQGAKNKMEFYADKLSRYLAYNTGLFPELSANNNLYQQWPNYGNQYTSPIVFRWNGRGRWSRMARKAGLTITDSRYPGSPYGGNVDWPY